MTAGPTILDFDGVLSKPHFETSALSKRALELKRAEHVRDALFAEPDGTMHDRVFVDDPFRNSAGAQAVGMQTVYFDVMTAACSTAAVACLTTTNERIAS